MKIAIVSHSYVVESSPTIKGICRYLADQGHAVDVFIDDLVRESSFKMGGVRIIKAGNDLLLRPLRWITSLRGNASRFHRVVKPLFIATLKKTISQYDWILCVEIESLAVLVKIGFDLSKASYLSLESVQTVSAYKNKITNIEKVFQQLAFCIIQSPERGRDLAAYLHANLDFAYLPVSLLPRIPRPATAEGDRAPRIIYSGYFADWAQLTEFIDAYSCSRLKGTCPALIQGHHMGTDSYLAQVKSAAKDLANLQIRTDFIDDRQHAELLDSFDIGLAFYDGPKNDPVIGANWQNLIFSSGKIASYLWSGLAVLTNIDSPISHQPPFLFLHEITPASLEQAVREFSAHRAEYRQSALECAARYYNMETAMNEIMRRVNLQT